jgi:7,8-dihydropterin-6-yl-methyl-4-(beta-D-ribofuranosyl)aminobenzene 5'-phosphate synthase
MGDPIVEQALVLETRDGLAVLTGCAHPDIGGIVELVRRQHKRKIRLVAGGFHLNSLDDTQFDAVVGALERNGVERIAPSHCTGERAIAALRSVWGDGFVEAGCGVRIEE